MNAKPTPEAVLERESQAVPERAAELPALPGDDFTPEASTLPANTSPTTPVARLVQDGLSPIAYVVSAIAGWWFEDPYAQRRLFGVMLMALNVGLLLSVVLLIARLRITLLNARDVKEHNVKGDN